MLDRLKKQKETVVSNESGGWKGDGDKGLGWRQAGILVRFGVR